MQFKQILSYLALAAMVSASPLAASPVSETSLATRDEDLGVDVIIDIAEAVVDLLKDIIEGIQKVDDEQHNVESNWTQSTVSNLQARYPDKNILIYHQQDSTTNFVNGVHSHYELDIGLGMTEGYEIWVLDSGSFDHSGDGGYINWCFSGNWKRSGSHIDFYTPGTPAPSKRGLPGKRDPAAASASALPAVTYSYAGHNATHSALHAPVTYTAPNASSTLMAPSAPTCDKARDDGHYFLHCTSRGSSNSSDSATTRLGLGYYKALVPHGGNKGQQPDDVTWLAAAGAANATRSAHADWKFPVGAVTYADTRSTVHWSLFGQAVDDTTVAGQTVGFADNGEEHFWMFKDDGERLFEQGEWSCDSLFYAY